MIKKTTCFLFLFIISRVVSFGQVTYLPLNTDDNLLLDRLETRSGRLSDTLNLSNKQESRERAVEFLLQQQNASATSVSKIDQYNIAQKISESGEWTGNENGAIDSKHPWFHTFYKKQYDFIHVHTNNFFVVVNPIISGEVLAGKNSDGTSSNGYWTSRGAEVRGWISKKIGFYTSATDNQEKPPTFVNNWITSHQAVPGADYYITNTANTTYDYLLATGYFDFAVIKDHLNVSFGYGKNFIGDGIQSMFLSDFSSSTPFLKLKTHIWKINYENLYLELTPQYSRTGDTVLPHKFATMQHLSMNVTKWLNIGLFESIIFDKPNTYEISYLNPVILLGATGPFLRSGDNSHLGIDFKAVAAKHLQFYGQFLINGFKSSAFDNGYWANTWALQLGGKYFDAFTVKNLDLQAELNVVRPYTYTHSDTIANYTNYNQPLADPLGANFIQLIGIARYQPVKRLFLTLKGTYYLQGVDTGGVNYGSDIFLSYGSRVQNYGVRILQGVKTNCALINLNVSYELKPNLFIDLGASHRRYLYENNVLPGLATTYTYCGIRLNIARRDYDFY
jgi:hypothetical protein